MISSENKGVLMALGVALVSGIAVFVNKFAVGAITPPLVFTATKNFGVGLLIVSLLVLSRKIDKVRELKRDEVVKLLAIGVVGGALPFYLFFTGLAQIPAINGAIIHKSLVLWVALLAIPLLKEKLSLMQVGAIGLMVSANLAIGGFSGFTYGVGELMVLLATMLWAVENVIAKKVLDTVDADLVVGARMGIGSVILMSAAMVMHPEQVLGVMSMTGTQWMWMLATAVTLFTYVMVWYRALKIAPVTLVATVLMSGALVTNVLSAVFVTGKLPESVLVQGAMMMVAVGLFVWEARNGVRASSVERRA